MKDAPMTWEEASNFTWDELQYFKWCDLALSKLELLKTIYAENEPLPPQTYEKLKCYCDGTNKLPPEITRIIDEGFLSVGKLTYICNHLKTVIEVTPAVKDFASVIQDVLLKLSQ